MYGVLKTSTNTGLDSELQYIFSAPLAVRSNQPAFISDTLSLKRKTNSQNVQRWEIEADIMPTNDSSNFLVHSVLNGHTNVFYLRIPQVFTPTKLSQTLSLSMINTKAQGSSTIDLTGLGALDLTGQFINFAGDSKVYLITSKGTSGIGVGISPSLISTVTAGTLLVTGDKVTMYARYDADTQLGITYTDGVLSSQGSVKFIEAL
jgi:hypothetical protein